MYLSLLAQQFLNIQCYYKYILAILLVTHVAFLVCTVKISKLTKIFIFFLWYSILGLVYKNNITFALIDILTFLPFFVGLWINTKKIDLKIPLFLSFLIAITCGFLYAITTESLTERSYYKIAYNEIISLTLLAPFLYFIKPSGIKKKATYLINLLCWFCQIFLINRLGFVFISLANLVLNLKILCRKKKLYIFLLLAPTLLFVVLSTVKENYQNRLENNIINNLKTIFSNERIEEIKLYLNEQTILTACLGNGFGGAFLRSGEVYLEKAGNETQFISNDLYVLEIINGEPYGKFILHSLAGTLFLKIGILPISVLFFILIVKVFSNKNNLNYKFFFCILSFLSLYGFSFNLNNPYTAFFIGLAIQKMTKKYD